MKKLSQDTITDMLDDYYSGEPVRILSKHYKVSQGTIYYNIKKQANRNHVQPLCYLDHIKNQILVLEEKIKKGELTGDRVRYAKCEIRRLTYWLKVDRATLSTDPFVLQ